MKLHNLFCFLLIIVYQITDAQTLQKSAVSLFSEHPAIMGGSFGVRVIECATGKELVADNQSLLLAPASTLKIVTTAAALELLGPGYRFRTVMGITGTSDSLHILKGNLVFAGGGDPTLGSEWFAIGEPADSFMKIWIGRLRENKIDSIDGNIVITANMYTKYNTPGSWAWEDLGNYYGASPSALTLFDNMIRLSFDSPVGYGQSVRLSKTAPPNEAICWENAVVSSSVNRDLAYVYGSPWDKKRVITGTIPAGRKNFEVKASMPDPLVFAGEYFRKSLEDAGIGITGKVIITYDPVPFTSLSVIESPQLSDIVRVINHESVNLFADHLVLQLGLEKMGEGSMEAGLQVIRNFWKGKGVTDSLFIEDGSGLSRFNAITPASLTDILLYMKKSASRDVFELSLPVAGKGTLASFSTESFPAKTIKAKSGSMERVRCYAGYLECRSGREVAFSVMINNFPGSQSEVTRQIQKLLLTLKNDF